jgi:hypothetical protein
MTLTGTCISAGSIYGGAGWIRTAGPARFRLKRAVGAKGAAALLRRYGTLEALLGLIDRIAKKVSAVGPDGKTLGEAGTRESTETIVKCIASDDPRLREK